MTVLEKVRDFVTQRGANATCDDCIADQLGLTVRQHANQKTRELAKSSSFDRRLGACASCKNTKTVIRAA